MVWGGESGLPGLLWDQVEVEGKGSARTWAQGYNDLISWGSESEEDLREQTETDRRWFCPKHRGHGDPIAIANSVLL
jgi:hypothetical protein